MGSTSTRLGGSLTALAKARAWRSKAGAMIATAGMPRSSKSAVSRTLRDVQEPQEPSATSPASTSLTILSNTSFGSASLMRKPRSTLCTTVARMPYFCSSSAW